MKFADINAPSDASSVEAVLQQEQMQGFGFYLTAPNHRVGWPAWIVQGLLAAGYQGMSIWEAYPATGNGAAEGAAAAAETRALGCTHACLAIEAGLVGHRAYCDAWNRAARAGGTITVGYSTPAGIRSDLYDFDLFWAAVPGHCDFGYCPGPAGGRAVQCGANSIGGVSYDISYGEWNMGIQDDVRAVLDEGTAFGFTSWKETFQHMANILRGIEETGVQAELDAIKASLAAIPAGGGLTAAQAEQLVDIQTRVSAIEAALRGA
jgi:hypothetical protein